MFRGSRANVSSVARSRPGRPICNANPVWYDDATKFQWTHELYPQIRKRRYPVAQADITKTSDLSGMRIATIHGYSYPTLENMWSTGQASRTSEERLDLMMKALTDHLADAAIVTNLNLSSGPNPHPPSLARSKSIRWSLPRCRPCARSRRCRRLRWRNSTGPLISYSKPAGSRPRSAPINGIRISLLAGAASIIDATLTRVAPDD